jgi:predicted permease
VTDWRALIAARMPDLAPEVIEELAQHLADLYDEARGDGRSHDEAERIALATLADSADTLQREVEAAARTLAGILSRRWQQAAPLQPDDGPRSLGTSVRGARLLLRDAWRSLLSTPAVTGFILVVLTLGISAATVTFSVVDAVIFRPLPFDEPDRLAVLDVRAVEFPNDTRAPVYLFEQMRARAGAFTSLGGAARGNVTLQTGDEPERLPSARVTASLFDALGVAPVVGRTFSVEHEVAGNDAVAVIGYDLWLRRFGGDPSVVGQALPVVDGPVTVVGVMPAGFAYPMSTDDIRPEVWMPFVADPRDLSGERLFRILSVVGRLAPGVSREAAEAEAEGVLQSMVAAGGPSGLAGLRVAVRSLADSVHGEVRGWMLLLLGAVGLVMLAACANAANLLLTRATRRARELAIRASMGASRRRLILTMLVESLLLSLIASALGVLAAVWGVDAARAAMPADIARVSEIALDLRVLVVVLAAAFATGLAFGVAPAWRASRDDLVTLLKDGAASATSGRTPLRSVFLVAEIAFVALLLVATTLFVASFVRVARADLGFERHDLLFATKPGTGIPVTDVLRALDEVPGVVRAGALTIGQAPLTIAGGFGLRAASTRVWRQGTEPGPDAVEPLLAEIAPGYFEALGIQVLGGRSFTGDDLGRTDRVILDTATARQLFGDLDPVGHEVVHGGGDPARVVGLVEAVFDRGPESPPTPQVYFPTPTRRDPWNALVVRVAGDAAAVRPAVAAALDGLAPASSRPANVRLLDDAFVFITASRRFSAILMAMFGGLALLIGAAGIYGVMASVVAQRSREIGIRLALGATGRAIVADVLGWAGRHLAAGLVIGLLVAAVVSRGFGSIFFGVTPGDLSVYAAVGLICLVAGLLASAIPARRASQVDPISILRAE